MQPIRARVRGGRLLVDEPTSLPEDTEVDLLVAPSAHLDAEEQRRLDEALAVGIEALRARRVRPIDDFLLECASRR